MPPFPVDLLADLHAGALDDVTAAHVRAHLDDDARDVLAALDRTVADLGAWPVPAATAPDDVLTRSRATLAGLSAQRPGGPRQARRVRGRVLAAAATVTAVAAGGITVAALNTGSGPDRPSNPVALSPAERATLLSALSSPGSEAPGSRIRGFADEARLRGCIRAHGIADSVPIAGSAPVRLRGRDGVVVLVTTGTVGRFTALVVGPDCGPGNPATIAETTIGG
ncbi:hypothetical protein GII30_23220 [Gordonia amarae]|nr:hypothetical protein [Gordonia amarae]MCS3876699.1 hypothetical protein [Gordonia amarae]QHN19577.1 hypothetical protein GII35_23705 [Gordonia amarae]QHN24040.1 hypothetical protein GII34_23135 [Gordonia amarae]QHN32957.1 hypothetical protein GII32_23505 [Gordonia amarae]QHN41677.1 hypothetical protein GII30_23220 [Gordonia amarae]